MIKNLTYSKQKGVPGHCCLAQVWDEDGNNLSSIKSNEDENYATQVAKLFASSPELLDALEQLFSVYEDKGKLLDYDINIAREAVNKAKHD